MTRRSPSAIGTGPLRGRGDRPLCDSRFQFRDQGPDLGLEVWGAAGSTFGGRRRGSPVTTGLEPGAGGDGGGPSRGPLMNSRPLQPVGGRVCGGGRRPGSGPRGRDARRPSHA